jgi:hypothetical protein
VSAARYHLQDQALEAKVRDLRHQIEELWREAAPMQEPVEEAAPMQESVEEAASAD